MRAAVTAFTGRGSRLAAKLLEALRAAGWEASAWIPGKYMDESLASAGCLANPLALSDWMEARMREETGAFVFVGACGIAVRVVAPWVNHKSTDPAVLAVDECFLPLAAGAGPGLAPCLAEHPNLLLLRAFTKSYAMAGLRLGYALSANGGLLERMAAAGPPWSVSTPAQAAGLAALEQCPDWPEKARTLLASERPALSDGLAALGLEVVPGQANYLLFRAAGAADLKERMLMRGVLIRSCANYHGLGNDWYRVCVGQAEQNRRLLAALKEVL